MNQTAYGYETVMSIHGALVAALARAGEQSPYLADANELDPRYLSYGVRAPALRAIWRAHREQVRDLSPADRLDLATLLFESGYGEQQSVGSLVLETTPEYFTAENLNLTGFMAVRVCRAS